jgi:glycerol-3-phosphate dehydrogenase
MGFKAGMAEDHYDITILGGGINGTAIALDAASRGLKVALIEPNDLGSGTSSWSTKLIHGGLRYLEQGRFGLVRSALKERESLLARARYLVRPLSIVFLNRHQTRPNWFIRLGLWIYDHLVWRHSFVKSYTVQLSTIAFGRATKPGIETGFCFSDARTDDSRLVLLNAKTAVALGADVFPRTSCQQVARVNHQWQVMIRNTDAERMISSKVMINCTGPWVNQVIDQHFSGSTHSRVKLVQGSHIVVPKMYEGDHAYLLTDDHKRVIFVIPYGEKFTLIGTTDTVFEGNPAEAKLTDKELSYLLSVVNGYFLEPMKAEDVIWSFSGVRALYAKPSDKPDEISREHVVERIDDQALLHVFGGKLTTHRVLAKKVIDQCGIFFDQLPSSNTSQIPLSGSLMDKEAWDHFINRCERQYHWLDQKVLTHYLDNYGTDIEVLLKDVDSKESLGEYFGNTLYEVEIQYWLQHEIAITAEDILWRRSKYGLSLSQDEQARVTAYWDEKMTGSGRGL